MSFSQELLITNSETGEMETTITEATCIDYDQETGEAPVYFPPPCHNNTPKKKFIIPKSCLQPLAPKKAKCCLTNSREIYTLANKNQVLNLKEEIILGYNKTSHRMFLIPTLFLCPRLAAILIVLAEVVLHLWAHAKNSRNHDPRVYYRSPLHCLTSQFCANCRNENHMAKIARIQDIRTSKRLYASIYSK